MKPGRPLTFATLEARTRNANETRQLLVFALPGNPVSSIVTFKLFAVPAIRHLSGWVDCHLRRSVAFTHVLVVVHTADPCPYIHQIETLILYL